MTFRLNHGCPAPGCVPSVVAGHNGRVLRHRTEAQMFNSYCRRAIALLDGGCISPSCYVPARWCEIPHGTSHAESGPTHTYSGASFNTSPRNLKKESPATSWHQVQ